MPTPKFGLAKTAAEARKIAEEINSNDLVGFSQWLIAMITDKLKLSHFTSQSIIVY